MDKKKLMNTDLSSLPKGFTIIFEHGKPVAAITNFKYYQYIASIIGKVKEYIQQQKGDGAD